MSNRAVLLAAGLVAGLAYTRGVHAQVPDPDLRIIASLDAVRLGAGPDTAPAPRFRTAVAGPAYAAGPFHRWVLGPHYRDVWAEPVRAEVMDLGRVAGGLTPTGTGGGMQTRSLRLRGADGREYAFRSIDKDPSAILDSIYRDTWVNDLVQDGISAAHPYAALVVSPLLERVGVLHAPPVLRVMPDDARLGAYRDEFAGMLGLLEERPDENGGGAAAFAGAARIVGSEKLTERLNEGPRDRVDARAFLRARLMDVFVGDWDRHRGQWRWATFDAEGPRTWVPIPKDRDQAFSRYDGVAPELASFFVPQFVRFGPAYPDLTRMHWNGRALDRWFLTELDRSAWDEVGDSVHAALTDSVIDAAVRRLPPEIHALHGEELAAVLRRRRDALPEAWDALYRLVSDRVDVRATDAREIVTVDRWEPGVVTLSIVAPDEGPEPYFHRRFLEDETSELRIHLRGGDDRITVTGDTRSRTTIRVLGGLGDDHYDFVGATDRVRLYDDQGDNRATGHGAPSIDDRPFQEWEWTPEDRDQPRDWGRRTTPVFWSSYGTDLGAFVGGGVRMERYGFRQRPFASALEARAGYAPRLGKARVEIAARFNRSNSDVFATLRGRFSELDVLHFYGFGNETPGGAPEGHRVDVGRASAEAGLGVAPRPWLEMSAFLAMARTRTRNSLPAIGGSELAALGSEAFTTLGLGSRVVVDPLAGARSTGHRVRLSADARVHPGVLDAAEPFGSVAGDLSVLVAPGREAAVSLQLRGGGRMAFGAFPWHEGVFVGGGATVRGWDEQRFAGDAALWGGGELRVRLHRTRIVLPSSVGLFGFADAGRVFVNGDSPGGWHSGVGGGVFVQPAGASRMVRLGAAVSPEATKVYLTFGLPY